MWRKEEQMRNAALWEGFLIIMVILMASYYVQAQNRRPAGGEAEIAVKVEKVIRVTEAEGGAAQESLRVMVTYEGESCVLLDVPKKAYVLVSGCRLLGLPVTAHLKNGRLYYNPAGMTAELMYYLFLGGVIVAFVGFARCMTESSQRENKNRQEETRWHSYK